MTEASSHDAACAVCQENTGARAMKHGVIYEDDLWLIRHSEPPYGVAGWVTLQAKRHVPGPFEFSDAEATGVGPAMRHLSKTLKAITGAPKIYIAGLGESYPHFHMHFVPRYEDSVKGWGVFSLVGEAAAGRVSVDEDRVVNIVAQLRDAFATEPLPSRLDHA